MSPHALRVAVVGAGWAGMAAAVQAVQAGHRVTVFEAARTLGGRARAVPLALPDGREVLADNGQHILIGAYSHCLQLMRQVGVNPDTALLRLPLALRYPDGSGLALPDWPAPLDALAGIALARGWHWQDKWALLRAAASWQRTGFACGARTSVADLCAGLTPRLRDEFIEPLCISALNTPIAQASGQVFLRVLRDALFSQRGGSNLLLPRIDLSALLPAPAARWLAAHGADVRTGQRVQALHWQAPHWQLRVQTPSPGNASGHTSGHTSEHPPGQHLSGHLFDRVILATSAPHALPLLAAAAQGAPASLARDLLAWQHSASQLAHRAITTVYAQASAPATGTAVPLLRAPMLALRASAQAPAQFVFDRDAIAPGATPGTAPTRLLAFVISDSGSACEDGRAALHAAIAAQARQQLGLAATALRTVTEKRATFACTTALARPAARITAGLLAAGDYVDGPYPATLEGAVRSGQQAADGLTA